MIQLLISIIENLQKININKRNDQRKYFLPRVNITNCNALIDDINFHDQAINNQIRKYDEIRKIVTGQGGDFTHKYV